MLESGNPWLRTSPLAGLGGDQRKRNRTMHRNRVAAIAVVMLGASVVTASDVTDEGHSFTSVANAPTAVGVYHRAGQVKRLYGEAFSHGASPEASAVGFLQANAQLLDADFSDLVQTRLQSVMYERADDRYKFTAIMFDQVRSGVPVFRGEVRLLVRNEPGYPLVLASNALRDLGDFEPALAQRRLDAGKGIRGARTMSAALDTFTQPELVIFAGVDDEAQAPRLGYLFIGDDSGGVIQRTSEKWLFIADAESGEIIYLENQILEIDVAGTVTGLATEGSATAECNPESATAMPYARVSIGGTVVFADVNGDFLVPNGGAGSVTVETGPRGEYFRVYHEPTGLETVESVSVDPPGPADLLLNDANVEDRRAEVNAYLHANVVRDFTLFYNPAYPAIGGQTEFSITVNEAPNSFCPGNAQYQGNNMRFCAADGSTPNTAWNSVVYHEYGHHLVAMAGSGQGQYGEGMGDTVSNVILDEPGTGLGFFGDCGTPLRTGDNSLQYPCGGGIHFCGQLLSGCVWDLRNELLATNPGTYYDIVASLTINSIVLHTGSTISPDITIDFLTLDDDDPNIFNGTPHYTEIAAAFGAHSMDAPALEIIGFDYPSGTPTLVQPGASTVVPVSVFAQTSSPISGTGMLHYSLNGGSVVSVSMNETSPNEYEAQLPLLNCDDVLAWWVSADSTSGNVTDPMDAPATTFVTEVASNELTSFEDDFQADLGWSVSDTGGLSSGTWEIGVPIDCDRADPPSDADGSGQCYLTENSAANGCDSDIDNGTTILTSPTLDATGDDVFVSYYRWYHNTYGGDPANDIFVVEVSDDDGGTWTVLEIVGPDGTEVSGGWIYKEFALGDIPGFVRNDQFRIRFAAQDINDGSVVEAGVDGVRIVVRECEDVLFCEADLTGPGGGPDGNVDALDILVMIGQWGTPCTGSCEADITGPSGVPDGNVDALDYLMLISQWGTPANCPGGP
jgi:hypothetical protein